MRLLEEPGLSLGATMKSTPTPRASRACPPLRLERTGRGARRSGQALLLAVLLMVFAALLGATMITLVSSNLNQTTRQGGLSAARSASTAAISLVNDRLTNSVEGESWRPWQDSPPPRVGQPDFNNYFSAFERSKGWVNEVNFLEVPVGDRNGNGITYAQALAANNEQEMDAERFRLFEERVRGTATVPGQKCYVKFPDPRGPITNASGPQYLVEVRPRVDAAGNPTGTLKMTVIGTSEDEPGAFDLQVADKPTSLLRGPFSYARFDSNYDYKRKSVISTKLTTPITGTTTTTTLVVENAAGFERGRTIIIGDPNTIVVGNPTTVQSAVVLSVTGNTITLSAPLTAPVPSMGFSAGPGFVAGTTVAVASPLMDGIFDADFDAEGDGTTFSAPGHTWESTREPVRNADASPALTGARKLFFNSGVALDGKSVVSLSAGDLLSVAGQIAPIPSGSVGSARLAVPGAAPTEDLPPSTSPISPSPTSLQRLVRDNRGAESSRIKPLTPPSIDGENSRYRELTQFAAPSLGSTQGYGPGVYINNRDDIEKVSAGVVPAPTALSIAQSQLLFGNKTLQFPNPAAPVTTGTLEERHIRGWISPWEFLPRGVLIELQGNRIIFTLDDLSDAAPNLPNPAKAWKRDDGTALTTPGANTFHMELDLTTGERIFRAPNDTDPARVFTVPGPAFNGLIFAEGNVRVRGFLDTKDVTIVSMGSIFIEGSLLRDRNNPDLIPFGSVTPLFPAGAKTNPPRLALLAKRNVVLNPTQFVAQVAGTQDRNVPALTLAAPALETQTSIQVNNPDTARVGDVIRVANDPLWHMIVSISGSTLTLSTPLGVGTNGAVGDAARRLSNPGLVTDTVTNETFYDVTAASGNVLARDVKLDGVAPVAPTYSLSWLQGGERVEALKFNRTGTGAATFRIKESTTVGTPDVISGLTPTNEKFITTSDGANHDLLDADGSGGPGGDATETLDRLKERFDNTDPLLENPDWEMNLSDPLMGPLPARRLAAVGVNPGVADDPSVAPAPTPPTGGYAVPLALSKGAWSFQPNWTPNTASLVPPVGSPGSVLLKSIGISVAPDGDDEIDTTREEFYQRNVLYNPTAPQPQPQAPLSWQAALGITPDPMQSNVLTFEFERAPVTGRTPNYRFGQVKVERDNFALPTTPRAFDAVPFNVQATIFAQEGSWFVVTPPLNPIPDVNNNATAAALVDDPDRAAATRYRRPNYRVVVRGSIVQNFAPTARTDETGVAGEGAMFRWINALSRPTRVENDGAATPSARGRDWQGIEYQADPLPFYNNLYLPPTPDLLYTS